MKSPTGAQLERASIIAVDSNGKKVPALPTGYEGIRCRETRPHALSSPLAQESREEQLERAGRVANQLASLTEIEHAVLRLQGKLQSKEEIRRRIYAGDLSDYLRDDYTLIPGSEEVHERKGLPPVTTVEVVGYEIIQVAAHDYAEMAERLGVDERTVKSAVASAHRKLRRAGR